MKHLIDRKRVASVALAHLRAGEMGDAHRILINHAETNDLSGHDGSWLRAARISLTYKDDGGARRCLLNVLEGK